MDAIGEDLPAWAVEADAVLAKLEIDPARGLDAGRASERRAAAPQPIGHQRLTDLELLGRQFRSPILLLLIAAAVLSAVLGETVDALIIAAIIAASGLLGFIRERGALQAVDALLNSVRVRSTVVRDGHTVGVAIEEVVEGDVVLLAAGDVIPGDARVLEANALLLDESALTGESIPRRKSSAPVPADTPVAERASMVHLGTHVVSGEGRILVVTTGRATEFGAVAQHLATRHVPTAFERGITRFGLLLVRATAVLVVAIFIVNVAFDRPLVEALLFSLALAVGLTPQMLPAIVSLSLSHGARAMAEQRVIVKRLDSIEDVGGLDVLCTDKTGTLTTGAVAVDRFVGLDGDDQRVAQLAWLNAHHQSGFRNPIDDAILAGSAPGEQGVLLMEVPFDFERKRLTVVVSVERSTLVITKGAVEPVLSCCSTIGGRPRDAVESALRQQIDELSASGLRVLGVATKPVTAPNDRMPATDSLEHDLDLIGLITLTDPPKPGARDAVDRLRALEVEVRLITGDSRQAAVKVAAEMGLRTDAPITGRDMASMDDGTLADRLSATDVCAEVTPLDKERIVRTLSKMGHTVGFLGDGINDAPALHVADVGISVDTAVDVAKQTADLVLLDKDLTVLADGIVAGRSVFANTLKYIHVTTSANFGNMLSMAAASLFLPYLPMLPTQILLLNFLSDIPGTTIATDRVEPEQLGRPRRWDVRQVRDFMLVFGAVSTVFDLLTFATLRLGFDAGPELFRTGWFIESTATELAVLLVLRTHRPFMRSRPGTALWISSAVVLVVTVLLPLTGLASPLGLAAPPAALWLALVAVLIGYVVVTELVKRAVPHLLGDPSGPTTAAAAGGRRSA